MIPVFDSTRDYRIHRDDYLRAFDRVLSSGRLVLGPETDAFEREFAASVGARHGVGVNSGTDALILALRTLDVRLGDEVLVPALTAPATAAAVRAVGAVPRFVDVCPATLTIDVDSAERGVSRRTRFVVPVHLHGAATEMTELSDWAMRRGLEIIEDCAQGYGTAHAGRHVGTFGAIGCFSFYPTKNLGAFGDGGMCVTDDPTLDRRLRQLRHYGLDSDRDAQCDGLNSRLDELQAALLRVKLPRHQMAKDRRRRLAARYRLQLAESDIRLPNDQADHSYHQFVIRSADRDQLTKQLRRAGVEFGFHYAKPLHLMPAYRFLGYQSGDLPHAERAANEVLSLPMFSELGNTEVDLVCEAITQISSRAIGS